MTREEKIALLDKLLEIEKKANIGNLTRSDRAEFQMWVKGILDQEPKADVLDKIKAEIEHLDYLNIEDGSDGYDKYVDQYDVMKIIDKYRQGG